jgi:hypothetical protein
MNRSVDSRLFRQVLKTMPGNSNDQKAYGRPGWLKLSEDRTSFIFDPEKRDRPENF